MENRRLQPGQLCRVQVFTVGSLSARTVFQTDSILLEAPNWTLDGKYLILNGDGHLWRISVGASDPEVSGPASHLEKIDLGAIPALNNDHVLSPDGEHIYLSANDWNIYRAPLAGGVAECITTHPSPSTLMHFLHGVSPDGRRLAFCGINPGPNESWTPGSIYTMTADGTDYQQLTSGSHSDGCEYAPDGDWIYFNTEQFDSHAQIARMRVDGSNLEQLTFDTNVNWFPHLSPDGHQAIYLAYLPQTQGHPADLWVEVRLVADGQWTTPQVISRFFGGQGTMNVNGWSPDSNSYAVVSYPLASS